MSPSWTVSLFWVAAAACVVVALAFVLPALLRARGGSGKAARRDVNIAVYRDQLKELDADRANGLLADDQAYAWHGRYACYLQRLAETGIAAVASDPATCPPDQAR